jgi:hypothetical protein
MRSELYILCKLVIERRKLLDFRHHLPPLCVLKGLRCLIFALFVDLFNLKPLKRTWRKKMKIRNLKINRLLTFELPLRISLTLFVPKQVKQSNLNGKIDRFVVVF